jgi:hypothetical protein
VIFRLVAQCLNHATACFSSHWKLWKHEARKEAGILKNKIEKYAFMFMSELWNHMLDEFHKASMTFL